jgi:hypothetical protein
MVSVLVAECGLDPKTVWVLLSEVSDWMEKSAHELGYKYAAKGIDRHTSGVN